jgi:hypothetical protein
MYIVWHDPFARIVCHFIADPVPSMHGGRRGPASYFKTASDFASLPSGLTPALCLIVRSVPHFTFVAAGKRRKADLLILLIESLVPWRFRKPDLLILLIESIVFQHVYMGPLT